MNIREEFEASRKYIELPIDQTEGTANFYDLEAPCCVGARLAQYCQVESGYFRDGLDAFAKRLGGNRAHLIVMLKHAGAGDDPFGIHEWKTPPSVVWERLMEVERLPSLVGADLRGVDLRYADLRDANLEGANLFEADLREANLLNANLIGANIVRAHITEEQLAVAHR